MQVFIKGLWQVHLGTEAAPEMETVTSCWGRCKFGLFVYRGLIVQLQLQVMKSQTPSLLSLPIPPFCLPFSGLRL